MADAVKVPCSNSNFGCDEYITYYQKEKHEKTCMHAPCFCPEDGCSFEGSTASLLNHFVTEHKWSPTNFHYDKAQRISIPRHSRFVLLVGEDQSMFLMVNNCVHIGNALTTVCIRPHESGSCYSSKISAIHRAEADKGRYLFQMDPHVASSSLHGGVQLGSRFFLLVPRDLVDESTDELTINVSIEKIKCAVHH
jgi:E3 ubiquitin-protein ligase SIAH1